MRSLRIQVLFLILVTLIPAACFAKNGNIGIFGIVDKVVFEPSEQSPQRIQVWGTFVVPVRMSSGQYQSPQRGVLYFELPAGREEAVRKEWMELKRMAGTGEAFGFTEYWVLDNDTHYSLVVTVHTSENLGDPEPYPLERGTVKADTGETRGFSCIINQLRLSKNQTVLKAACGEIEH